MSDRIRLLPLAGVLCALLGSGFACAQHAPSKRARAGKRAHGASARAEADKRFLEALRKAEALAGEDPGAADALLARSAKEYRDRGEYAKAEALDRLALRVREELHGPDHPAVATRLNSLGWACERQGKHDEAERLLLRSLAIREKALGPKDLKVALTLNNLASLYYKTGKLTKAQALYRRAVTIRQKALGPDHPKLAESLRNLAAVYRARGKPAWAGPLEERARTIFTSHFFQQLFGRQSSFTALALTALSAMYGGEGQFAEAEALCRRALEIREKVHGLDHPLYGDTLHLLALTLRTQGQYAEAEALFKRSLVICEKAKGRGHLDVASALSNLAELHREQGRYGEAETFCRRALDLRKKANGPDHPATAASMHNLASLWAGQGKSAEAEALFKRALAIWQKPQSFDSMLRLRTFVTELSTGQGDAAASVAARSRALSVWREFGKPDSLKVAACFGSLAGLYHDQGRHAEAEAVATRGLAILEKRLGPDHPAVVFPLNRLGTCYHSQRKYARAEALYKRALTILEKTHGPDHPHVAVLLHNLTWSAVKLDNLEEAWRRATRAREILQRARTAAGRSAIARAAFFGTRARPGLVAALALKLSKDTDVLALLEQERSLGLRELLAQARAQTAAPLPHAARQRVTVALRHINALNAHIERRVAQGLPVEALRDDLRDAEMAYDSLMGDLGQQHEQFVAAQTARAITSKQAMRSPALDGQTAIVGWAGFGDWLWGYVVRQSGVEWVDLSDLSDRSDKSDRSDRPDEGEQARRVLLALRGGPRALPSPEDLAALYQRRFAPLEPHLRAVKRLIVIAQGWMAYVPAEAWLSGPAAKGEEDPANWPWLCERYEISYAPSVTTLDLLCRQRDTRKGKRWARTLFALGDPPFSPKDLAAMQAEKQQHETLVAHARGPQADAVLTRAVRFDAKAVIPRLPGTRREVRLISALLGAGRSQLLLGPDACEGKLFEASGRGELRKCRYLHLATHGLADSERPELSALLLARVPRDEGYDGVLHMREVFHLKLDADLVVLSACQTGLGRELRGEGVVGLSTAFFFAGTPSLVMSLWNVPDVSAALLMHRFYANLRADQTKAAALRDAKRWLRNLTHEELERLRRRNRLLSDLPRGLGAPTRSAKGALVRKPFAHPHYWAGFVLTGDPR